MSQAQPEGPDSSQVPMGFGRHHADIAALKVLLMQEVEDMVLQTREANLEVVEKKVRQLERELRVQHPASSLALPKTRMSLLEIGVVHQLNDIVNRVLERNLARVDCPVGLSCTALCKACYACSDNLGLVKILLFYGSDVNATISNDGKGASCLMTAVIQGNLSLVELLLAYDADVYYEWKGQNALSMSIDFRRSDIAAVIENREAHRVQEQRALRKRAARENQPEAEAEPFARQVACFPSPAAVDFSKSLSKQSILSATFVSDLKALDWIFCRDEIEITSRTLGKGGFGCVCIGIVRSTGERVAVKKVTCNDEKLLRIFKGEVSLLSKFRHQNIVLFL
eukprot:gene4489-6958_t